MEDERALRKALEAPTLGDCKITLADGKTMYQPDILVLGDTVGAKIGQIVLVFRDVAKD